ncbi:LOW QUALITY PROTEIN: hypothetical protein U9M48_001062, partial [Paspalum notatum var. saurae]
QKKCDGQVLYDDRSKTEALTIYYEQLLGSPALTSWGFDLDRLYANKERVQQDALIAPFYEQKFGNALKSINKNSVPGPDGFGAGFYSAAWNFIKPVVMSFADGFYKGEIQLSRVNRAYIVLLPKKQGALQPGNFRPISLQNLSVKLLTKVLKMRVQEQIQRIVAIDQTGFISGRSISENFVLATELVQCCHKRKAAALVFKLDFAKAFDSVDWGSLLRILEVCGFSTVWCGWINDLLRSSMSAVLVNGVPGRWINCKRGLRQGDPISPYLFILVADVLQALITSSGEVHHPLVPSLPCPILQYADDTLLIIPALQEEVQALKTLLDLFSEATGLRINFQKSTMVPMNITMDHAQELQGVMGCKLEGFPQVYLGLPLSNVKLNLSTFGAVISKVDKRLAGWQGKMLNAKGRSVLVNSVLDGTVTYSMAALLLPPGVLAALDQRRRAFLWSGAEHKTKGGQCLIAWPGVCTPKECGGLGIKDLALQNQCLLLKMLHRLYMIRLGQPEGLDLISLKGPWAVGAHWDALRCVLPLYRSITVVRVGSGDATNFWDDVWLGEKTLAEQYPVLFSHALPPAISVSVAKRKGLRRFLVPRLTHAAKAELNVLQAALSDIHLSAGPDQRLSPFVGGDGSLRTGSVYRTIKRHVAAAPPFTEFVWNNKAPPKVQYFGWLLVQQRIKCRYNLKKKNIVDDDGDVGTPNHLVLQCPFSKNIWARLHIDTATHDVSSQWELPQPLMVLAAHYNMFLLMVSWFLWKHRNDVTFNSLSPCRGRLKAALLDAAPLWCHRLHVAKCWPTKRRHIQQLSVAEMRMLRWMCGHTRIDRVRNDEIRDRLGVAPIEEKLVQHRLRWFGHVQRRPLEAPVHSGIIRRNNNVKRGRGRPNLTWEEAVKRDLRDWNIVRELALDRAAWKAAIHNSTLLVELLHHIYLMATIQTSFVGSCAKKLQDFITDGAILILGVKEELTELQRRMELIQHFLNDAEQRSIKESAINNWLDAMYDADDTIDLARSKGNKILPDHSLSSASSRSNTCNGLFISSCFSNIQTRHEIAVKIRNLNKRIDDISKDKVFLSLANTQPTEIVSTPKQRRSPNLVEPNLVGKEVIQACRKVIDLVLALKEKKSYKLAILGTGGVGKTTLAQKARVCISKDYSEVAILQEILRRIEVKYMQDESIEELQSKLEQAIEGKIFFLVLDDVWKSDLWINLLRIPLYAAAIGIILLTTRLDTISVEIGVDHTHRVDLMLVDVGWELLWKSMEINDEKQVQHLEGLGKDIVRRCGGLPLAIKVIARVLACKDQSENEWKKILEKDAWSMSKLPSEIIYLSFEDLPHHLKQCFIYFALFSEDAVIYCDDILRMWVAEGFINEEDGQLLEDTAEEYYFELIYRNLLQPDNLSVDLRKCKMHDLLRQLACHLSRQECFVSDPESISTNAMSKFRRISVVTTKDMVVLPGMEKDKYKVRTWRTSYTKSQRVDDLMFKRFPYIQALDLNGSVINSVPSCIGRLIHLVFELVFLS